MGKSKVAFANAFLGIVVSASCVNPPSSGGTRNGNANSNNANGRPVTLRFAAVVGDQTARCGQMYSGLGTSNTNAEILDMRLYVSNIQLINDQGQRVPLTLDQAEPRDRYQYRNVALLDFEDATGRCSDMGTSGVNAVVTGRAPAGTYRGVEFDLGVPFDLNHTDLTAAHAPLNLSGMFWTWQIGHKFLRVDMRAESGNLWTIHVGSTMCTSSAPSVPPVSECGHPNRPTISLAMADPETDTIVLDLQRLFANSDLTQDTPNSAAGCQSAPDDTAECTPIFPNIGLDFATGQCTNDCSAPTFRVESAITRGQTIFRTPHPTVGGQTLACAGCHGENGTGISGAGNDIRADPVEHLRDHSQLASEHPEGVKFPTLQQSDYNDIKAFLNSLCAPDPTCIFEEEHTEGE